MDPYRAGSIAVGVGCALGAALGATAALGVATWLFPDPDANYRTWRDALFFGGLFGGMFGYWYTDRLIDQRQR